LGEREHQSDWYDPLGPAMCIFSDPTLAYL